MKIIKIGLCGAYGNMGRAIEACLINGTSFELVSKLGSSASTQQIFEACSASDIIIDFSSPSSLEILTNAAGACGTKLLVGTTGLTTLHMDLLHALAEKTAVIYAPNTSISANLIAEFAARAAKVLHNYDAEIIESHHRRKKDAPSGTAIMIGREIARARGIDFDENAVFDRSSRGVRAPNDIGFSSLRAGGIFGDNEAIFAGDNEMISISCRAFSRNAFAEGALAAAKWLINKKPGLYSMMEVLDL